MAAQKGIIDEGGFTHAGEIMTSVILALKPESVSLERSGPGSVKPLDGSALKPLNSIGDTAFQGSVQTVFQDIRQVTDNGTLGDPSGATAEKGQALLGHDRRLRKKPFCRNLDGSEAGNDLIWPKK